MSIEMDIRKRLIAKLNDWVMAAQAKDEITAIFDDMLLAHETIVERHDAERYCERCAPTAGCSAAILHAEIDELERIEAALRRGDKP